jgi:hypothetical protein
MTFFKRPSLSIAIAAMTIELACIGDSAGEDRAVAETADSGRPALIIIYDSSNSMRSHMPSFGAATAAEASRYGVAKRFTQTLVDRLAPVARSTDAGVLLFGSRRASDCLDRKLEVPLRPFTEGRQADEIKDAINRASPLGTTPIADSIRDAAEILKGREPATIILVSDGIEECNADPCAVAAEIKRSNARFVVHVIGVAVSPGVFGRVACMADITGGVAAPIRNSDDLEMALVKMVEAVKPAIIPLTRILATVQVRATETFPAPFPLPNIRISGQSLAAGPTQQSRGTLTTRVEPGDYRIEFQFGDEISSKDLTITADAESVVADYVFEPGILAVRPFIEDDVPPEGQPQILWQIEALPGAESGSNNASSVSYLAPELRIFVPPGRYRITAKLEGRTWNVVPDPVVVKSGAESTYSLEMK